MNWLSTRREKPDADRSVLVGWRDDGDFERGHWDGETWREDASMLPFNPQPDLWTDVVVPECDEDPAQMVMEMGVLE